MDQQQPKKALVGNAADEQQVKTAAKKEVGQREKELNDMRSVLSTAQGRRVLFNIMAQCRTYNSVLHQSGSMVYYNAGQQDIGHWLQKEIVEADTEAYFKILKERVTNS